MKSFFYPKTIAVIGASDEQGKVGYSLMKNLENFKGKVVPINIGHETIARLRAYKIVLDYAGKIDLAVIAIPAQFVASVLEECGKKKIRDIIIISAGFSEIGNNKDEDELIKISKKYNIKLLGPNCFGVCNPHINLDTTFALSTPEKGNIAFISQSGALWSYISDFSLGKFGFSGFVSLGNMAGVSFEEFIQYFSKDKQTKSIVLYVEKLKDGKKFIAACKKCKKPIYAVKVGTSKEGSKAAVSHTGSLATDFKIYKGAFKQAGVILCSSLEECFERASGKKLIAKRKEKKLKFGSKAVIITNAGGAGALMADYLSINKIKIADWSEKNPLDLLGTAGVVEYKNALEKLKGKNFYDFVVVILTPQKMTEIMKTAEEIVNFAKQSGKEVIACFLGGKSIEQANKLFKENKIQYISTLEQAI